MSSEEAPRCPRCGTPADFVYGRRTYLEAGLGVDGLERQLAYCAACQDTFPVPDDEGPAPEDAETEPEVWVAWSAWRAGGACTGCNAPLPTVWRVCQAPGQPLCSSCSRYLGLGQVVEILEAVEWLDAQLHRRDLPTVAAVGLARARWACHAWVYARLAELPPTAEFLAELNAVPDDLDGGEAP